MTSYAEACLDPQLFGPWFDGPSWSAWRVLDKAIYGDALSPDEFAVFRDLTGRSEAPTAPATEVWISAGRRASKTLKAASHGVYLATIGAELFGYRDCLQRGERGVVQILAVDRDQARVALNYVRAFFEQPILQSLVVRDVQDGIELTNGLGLEVATNDQRRVRGRTVVAAIFDEVAHWRTEGVASPDEEVYRAVKPASATIPGALMLAISSPYARRGLLWRKYQQHYGKPGPVLVVKAASAKLNPTLDPEIIADAIRSDPHGAAAEWMAEFRSDVESFVEREAVEACIADGIHERPHVQGVRYVGFTDPSGGSRDSFTAAVAHLEGEVAVLDAVRERTAPFSPESVIEEFSDFFKSYGVRTISGDRYSGEFARERFRVHGIEYRTADKPKSEIYLALLPLINSRRADLLDDERLIGQLVALERRTARGGRDSVDHPPGPQSRDDRINSAAGALVEASRPRLNDDPGIAGPMIFTYDGADADFSSLGEQNYV
jgi:hypothetical protein